MKLLITHACAAPTMDGPAHYDANTVAEFETDVAHAIVAAGKALYIEPKDDRSRTKVATASEARIEAVRSAMKAASKAAKKAAAGDADPDPAAG
ncbi:MAG: hypothetical protein RJA36_3408 [Pseudomonadota bacterium]|jgi:hypothetical protein